MTDDHPRGRESRGRPSSARVLCDVMLGKLAVYLRMCGYDTAYVGDRGIEADDRIRQLARKEDRMLLSRDTELSRRTEDAILLTERNVVDQLEELRAAGFDLALADPPTRCGRCNGVLESVPEEVARPNYAPDSRDVDCWRCTDCGQFFWKGSHWDRVREAL